MHDDDDDEIKSVKFMSVTPSDLDEWGLDPDDPDFYDKLTERVMEMVSDSDTELMFPQNEQREPLDMCVPVDSWERLADMSADTLEAIGCVPFTETDDGEMIMLFPEEWYDYIPRDMKLINIEGDEISFSPGFTTDTTSMGVLSYGVMVNH